MVVASGTTSCVDVVSANEPLIGGPFKEFLAGLHRIQSEFSDAESPIRTALVTARSAPARVPLGIRPMPASWVVVTPRS